MKKEHGEHNRNLCDELLQKCVYTDWIITTAFYSSIHFIDHKLFPVVHNGVNLMDIDHAHKVLRKPSRHRTREFLVTLYMPGQVSNYGFLDSNCRNARYVNYKVSPSKAKVARQRLGQLINACS